MLQASAHGRVRRDTRGHVPAHHVILRLVPGHAHVDVEELLLDRERVVLVLQSPTRDLSCDRPHLRQHFRRLQHRLRPFAHARLNKGLYAIIKA